MKAYLTKSSQREARSNGVSDTDCQEAIRRAERGLVDADLGGRLIKQRIPRGNQGAARGSRAVVFFKRGEIAIFLHLFAKSDKANLTKSELVLYLEFAKHLEELTQAKLRELGATRGWREIEI
jgi:hypothetical protein